MKYTNSFKYKVMKKSTFILILAAFFLSTGLKGQNPNLEKFNSYKIGFFTKKMNLSTEEAEKFWPLYNEYQQQRNQIQRDKILLARDFNQNGSVLSDKQLTEMGDQYIKDISDETALAISFHKKIKEILPPAKVIRYYQAENQYKIQLLKELQENRQQKRGNMDPDF
jgi:hypothetical protein